MKKRKKTSTPFNKDKKEKNRKYQKEHYQKNREKKLAQSKAYYYATLAYQKDRSKRYRESHKELTSLRGKKYYQKNKEQVKQNKEKNKAKRREHYLQVGREYNKSPAGNASVRKYQKDNPEKRLKLQINYLKRLGKLFDMDTWEMAWALQDWSRSVRKRQSRCICGKKATLAHHCWPKRFFPENSLELDNGLSMCKKCHAEAHKKLNEMDKENFTRRKSLLLIN